jgi:hypothetical protein
VSLSKQFKTDKKLEAAGIWVEYGPNSDGTIPSFLIARMGKSNKKFQKAAERATKPHKRAIQLGRFEDALAEKIYLDVFVSTILLDWKNVPLSDIDKSAEENEKATFNAENAKALLTNLDELYDDLQEKAQQAGLFQEADLEVDAEN